MWTTNQMGKSDFYEHSLADCYSFLRSKRLIWWVLFVALMMRSANALFQPIDEQEGRFYREIGLNLAHGFGYTWTGGRFASDRAPLTSFIVAIIYRLGGNDWAVRQCWAVLSVLCVAAAYCLVRAHHGIVAANLSAIGVTIYPYNILIGGWTSTETPAVLLTFLCILCFLKWEATGSLKTACITGGVLGFAVLNRPPMAAYGLVLPLLLWRHARQIGMTAQRRIVSIVGFGVVSIVVVSPWTIYVSRKIQTPCLVTSVGPGNLWQGLNPWVAEYLDGSLSSQDFLNEIDSRTYGLWDNSVSWKEKNRAYKAAVRQFIQENPMAFARLMVYRTVKFWQIPGLSTVRTTPDKRNHFKPVIIVGCLSYVPLAVVTLVGVAVLGRKRKLDLIGIYLIWIVVAFVTNVPFSSTITRYRFASGIDDLMILIAAIYLAARFNHSDATACPERNYTASPVRSIGSSDGHLPIC